MVGKGASNKGRQALGSAEPMWDASAAGPGLGA